MGELNPSRFKSRLIFRSHLGLGERTNSRVKTRIGLRRAGEPVVIPEGCNPNQPAGRIYLLVIQARGMEPVSVRTH